jgi:hypothetical protein
VAFRVEDTGDVLLCSVSLLWATCKWLWVSMSGVRATPTKLSNFAPLFPQMRAPHP